MYRVFTREFDRVSSGIEVFREAVEGELSHRRVFAKAGKSNSSHVDDVQPDFDTEVRGKQLEYREWGENLLSQAQEAGNHLDFSTALPNRPLLQTGENQTTVSILLDNSGSLRGRPAAFVYLFSRLVAQQMQNAGISFEILGYTTQEWKGGQSRQLWLESDRPEGPGRLNDLQHTIFKPFDETYDDTTPVFEGVLTNTYTKQNIDGEALEWAYERLKTRPEERKILIHLSDGDPCDYSSDGANGYDYLKEHQISVLEQINHEALAETICLTLRSGNYTKPIAEEILDSYGQHKEVEIHLDEAMATVHNVLTSILSEQSLDIGNDRSQPTPL
tara:strand:+ start:109369 stop:110361 length:993 start_codon:yes stop_codon:yes gene_type:complete